MLDVLTACGATRVEVSRDEAQRLRFWSGRKNAFPATGRISTDYMCMTARFRAGVWPNMLAIEGSARVRLACLQVFHAGDGNLHPLILYDPTTRPAAPLRVFGDDILETSVAMGGSVTGEHGVGVEKLNSMCVQFSSAERAAMTAVKHAFDPGGTLNPGKVIPTLQRCAEYGKMHVRGGLLAFPELERF